MNCGLFVRYAPKVSDNIIYDDLQNTLISISCHKMLNTEKWYVLYHNNNNSYYYQDWYIYNINIWFIDLYWYSFKINNIQFYIPTMYIYVSRGNNTII